MNHATFTVPLALVKRLGRLQNSSSGSDFFSSMATLQVVHRVRFVCKVNALGVMARAEHVH
jgi:hypothetical protein